MSAAVEVEQLDETALDGIACHCGDDERGHVPGEDGCAEAPIKTRQPRPFSAGPTTRRGGAASGTCPECDQARVKVTAVMRLGAAWHRKGPDPKLPHRVRLGLDVRLAAHKGPGRGAPACEFTGPPVELTFTPAREHDLAVWEREHGPGSVR